MIPIKIKKYLSVEMFKNEISKWELNGSERKLCQDDLYRNGYVNLFDDQSICCLNFDTGHCGSQGSFHK